MIIWQNLYFLRFFFNALLIGIVIWSPIDAQELPPIRNFLPIEYHGQNQNWSIAQSDDKLIYVANNQGLLEFDGARWSRYDSPNETIMRSVKPIGNRIYTGCYMEFGYWIKNRFGVLKYYSISNSLNISLIEDEEFWNIYGIDNWVIFQSLNRLYIYDTKQNSIRIIESEDEIVKMYLVENSIYFQKINKGIYRIKDGEARLYLENEIFKTNEVVNIFPNKNGILLLTQRKGFYQYENEKLSAWKSVNKTTSGLNIYNAKKSSSGDFILGTISNGLVSLNAKGDSILEINQNNGLANNTVLSILEDVDKNIWVGLDNGISVINVESPIKYYKDKEGALGSVYASAVYKNRLYLGTNQGLFQKELSKNEWFKKIPGTQGQVWSLKVIEGTLFCGHHRGTYIIENQRAVQIASIPGTWDIKSIDRRTNRVLQGNYDGLYVLEKVDYNWQLRNKLEGFNISSRHFEIYTNDLFVNHEYKGIFHLKVDENFSHIKKLSVDTIQKWANSGLSIFRENVIHASKDGIYVYDKEEGFKVDSILSSIYTEEEYLSGRMISTDEKDDFWIFTKDNITSVTTASLANTPTITTIPITNEIRSEVVEFENLVRLDESSFLIGTSYGYLMVDINDLGIREFNVNISTISNGINPNYSVAENLIDKSVYGQFKTKENNLSLNFFTPTYFEFYSPNYQYQLEGIYDKWSDWSTQPYVSFENLPPGDYTFNLRAKVGNKISKNIATYTFSIAKPWFATKLMITLYVLTFFLLTMITNHLYKRYYRKKEEKLIEENKKELEFNKLQSEKEIIKLKNEQLEKDFKNKNKELAASTMSIIEKNELLNQIKEQLIQIEDKEAVKPVIKTINRNLNQSKNWEIFQEAFNSVDQEFFKRIKEMHPSLSPNDLKLCAYLRLNLSSKEISGLFNISPRSVEVKRYRLRKKLKLSSDENLSDHIINI